MLEQELLSWSAPTQSMKLASLRTVMLVIQQVPVHAGLSLGGRFLQSESDSLDLIPDLVSVVTHANNLYLLYVQWFERAPRNLPNMCNSAILLLTVHRH